MKDYYKIGEISKIYGIGRDSLMYYEDIGILKPFRDKNGYRMYKLSDIWRLNLIKELRSLNFPMKKIKEYLDDRNIESTKEILNKEIILIDEKIEEAGEEKELIITVSKEAYKVVNDEGEKIFDSSSSVLFVGTNGPDKRSEALTGKMTKQVVIKSYEGGNFIIPALVFVTGK